MLSLRRLAHACAVRPLVHTARANATIWSVNTTRANATTRAVTTARMMYCTQAAVPSVQDGEDVSCSTAHGRFQLPLPLAHGTTVFSLSPHMDVASLAGDIAQELDGSAAGDVRFETADGVRIAKSHLLGPLLKTGDFAVVVGGKRHRIQMPAEVVGSDAVDESMAQVQRLVRDLYTTLDGARLAEVEQQRAEEELKTAQAEVAPLLEAQKALVKKANRRADVITWGGLAVMTLQFGFLYELSFNIFSWDLMEPVTYFVGYTQLLFFAAWHAISKQDYSYEGYHRRQYSIGFHKGAKRGGLDLDRLGFLTNKIEKLTAQLDTPPTTPKKEE